MFEIVPKPNVRAARRERKGSGKRRAVEASATRAIKLIRPGTQRYVITALKKNHARR
jgi:hypothetical protein